MCVCEREGERERSEELRRIDNDTDMDMRHGIFQNIRTYTDTDMSICAANPSINPSTPLFTLNQFVNLDAHQTAIIHESIKNDLEN